MEKDDLVLSPPKGYRLIDAKEIKSSRFALCFVLLSLLLLIPMLISLSNQSTIITIVLSFIPFYVPCILGVSFIHQLIKGALLGLKPRLGIELRIYKLGVLLSPKDGFAPLGNAKVAELLPALILSPLLAIGMLIFLEFSALYSMLAFCLCYEVSYLFYYIATFNQIDSEATTRVGIIGNHIAEIVPIDCPVAFVEKETESADTETSDSIEREKERDNELNKRGAQHAAIFASLISLIATIVLGAVFFSDSYGCDYIYAPIPACFLALFFVYYLIYKLVVFWPRSFKKIWLLIGAQLIFSLIFIVYMIMMAISLLGTASTEYIANLEDYEENWHYSIFPEEITEDMTLIKYRYRNILGWDTVSEEYLEVIMEEDAYLALKESYRDEITPFPYADGYLEYVENDNLGYDEEHPEYTTRPNLLKIIFNDEERIVIFVGMYGFDPYYYKDSFYLYRFNIKPEEYIIPEKEK